MLNKRSISTPNTARRFIPGGENLTRGFTPGGEEIEAEFLKTCQTLFELPGSGHKNQHEGKVRPRFTK